MKGQTLIYFSCLIFNYLNIAYTDVFKYLASDLIIPNDYLIFLIDKIMDNSKIKCLSRCGFIDRCSVAQYQYGNCLLYSNTTFSITQLNNAPGAIIYQKSAKITGPSTNPKTFLTSSEATNSVSYTTYGAACSVLTPCQGLSCIYGFCQCSSGFKDIFTYASHI